jgi:hypothetical protein
MAENSKQLDNDGFGEISDDMIRRFLLGGLAAGEPVVLEQRLFSDESFAERVHLAEFELADDYAFERLTAAERAQFASAFPVSLARRQQLSVSRALRDSSLLSTAPAVASPVKTRTTVRELLLRLFGSNRPVLGYALGFAALLLFAGIVWMAVKERRSGQPVIATYEPTPLPSPAASRPTETQTPVSTVSPEPASKPSGPPDNSSTRTVIATFVLSPGALRDGGDMTRLAVPQTERGMIRLQLMLETNATAGPGSYAAELLTAEGRALYVSHKLKTSNPELSSRLAFDVPRELLQPGDYQVKLGRRVGGSTTSAGRYSFRVTE